MSQICSMLVESGFNVLKLDSRYRRGEKKTRVSFMPMSSLNRNISRMKLYLGSRADCRRLSSVWSCHMQEPILVL